MASTTITDFYLNSLLFLKASLSGLHISSKHIVNMSFVVCSTKFRAELFVVSPLSHRCMSSIFNWITGSLREETKSILLYYQTLQLTCNLEHSKCWKNRALELLNVPLTHPHIYKNIVKPKCDDLYNVC